MAAPLMCSLSMYDVGHYHHEACVYGNTRPQRRHAPDSVGPTAEFY